MNCPKVSGLMADPTAQQPQRHRPRGDAGFHTGLTLLSASYLGLVLFMMFGMVAFLLFRADWSVVLQTLQEQTLLYATGLSLLTCTITMILSVWVSVPIGYVMARLEFPGKAFVDAVLDIPIVLPPLVIGIALLIMFKFLPESLNDFVVFEIPAVILAQFAVACAFAVRTMRSTFDQLSPRAEHVALTLGASRGQAFFRVVLPEAWRGVIAAAILAWARSLGEFGPILIFAGTTPMRTEVLTSTVYLKFQNGELVPALVVSLFMVIIALVVMVCARVFGLRQGGSL